MCIYALICNKVLDLETILVHFPLCFFSTESRDKKKQAKCQLTVSQKIGITEER